MSFSKTSLFARALLMLLPSLAAPGIGRADGMEDHISLPSAEYSLEIDKSARELLLRQGSRIARKYRVAVGRGGHGEKQIRGDNKTPEGVYYIAGFNEESTFDIFFRLNYPNVKDGFFGLQRLLITRQEFNQIVDAQRQDALPPQNTPLGGAIGIHGIGQETPSLLKIHRNMDWTKGCIALTNREIHELRSYVDVGTRVVIRE
ncbi:MAG: L,D-transpeptidase [Gammaproteobacteria bacterium]|nr:L,D-transpeptidase [Gammaproteobacteria bacterium]